MKFNPTLYKLSNGISVIIDPMDIATVNMTVRFNIGSQDETEHEFGITHFLEHVLTLGTTRFPNAESIDNYVWNNGGTTNAYTGIDCMAIHGRILAENFFVLADSLADKLQNSLFLPATIDNERKVIQDELCRCLDDPYNVWYYFTEANLFANSGRAHHTIGTKQTVDSFDSKLLQNYFNEHFSAENTTITVVGKTGDSDVIINILEKLFGNFRNNKVPESARPKLINYGVAHNSRPGQDNLKLLIGFNDCISTELKDRYSVKCLGLWERTLQERLMNVLRNKHGLTYGIRVGGFGDTWMGANTIEMECASDKAATAVKLIAETCHEFMNSNPMTADELSRVKIMTKFNIANQMESANNRGDVLFNFYNRYGLVYNFDKDADKTERATLQDIADSVKNYFASPISILTQCADAPADDLKNIWYENFK